MLQTGTRTMLTEIDVPNQDHALTPGIYCTVELKILRKTPSLIVPSEAIIFNRQGLSVAVIEDGRARIHRIDVVRDFGTTVEVRDGVKDGDQVILNPPVDLTDGSAVRSVLVRPRRFPEAPGKAQLGKAHLQAAPSLEASQPGRC
jgi:multidrug efflux pump subunit AcrA (membrane-fusion protein)